VVQQVQEFYADFVPINHELFSLNVPSVTGLSGAAWDQAVFDRVHQGVCAALLGLKKRPVVRYQANSEMAMRLAESTLGTMDTEGELFGFRRSAAPPPSRPAPPPPHRRPTAAPPPPQPPPLPPHHRPYRHRCRPPRSPPPPPHPTRGSYGHLHPYLALHPCTPAPLHPCTPEPSPRPSVPTAAGLTLTP